MLCNRAISNSLWMKTREKQLWVKCWSDLVNPRLVEARERTRKTAKNTGKNWDFQPKRLRKDKGLSSRTTVQPTTAMSSIGRIKKAPTNQKICKTLALMLNRTTTIGLTSRTTGFPTTWLHWMPITKHGFRVTSTTIPRALRLTLKMPQATSQTKISSCKTILLRISMNPNTTNTCSNITPQQQSNLQPPPTSKMLSNQQKLQKRRLPPRLRKSNHLQIPRIPRWPRNQKRKKTRLMVSTLMRWSE